MNKTMFVVTIDCPGTDVLSKSHGLFLNQWVARSFADKKIGDLQGKWMTDTHYEGFNGHHKVIVRINRFDSWIG